MLAVKGAVYDSDTCRKRAKRDRYKANREAKGLSRNSRTAKHLAEAEEYKRAKFGEDYRGNMG